jgi:hypothetical protein
VRNRKDKEKTSPAHEVWKRRRLKTVALVWGIAWIPVETPGHLKQQASPSHFTTFPSIQT